MKGDRRFVASMLVPTFFFLICFYAYPTLYNLMNSFTDLSLFGAGKVDSVAPAATVVASPK